MVKAQVLTAAMLALACILGCAPGPRPALKRLYEGLKEPIEGIDLSGLAGRKVVIDPGHGGVFRGARGIRGTDEADVNLGVALHLAKLLEGAGAQVVLTRSADVDFASGDSTRLRDDLKARVEIANRIDPDIFMSLHHNADPSGDRGVNEIQIYYRFADDGPSLDVAGAVAAHLVANLGEDRNRVVPGNYYVLRNAVSPAVLCEPSYISNPKVEAEIGLAEKQWLEAAAYFLGLVDYFSEGVPRVIRLGVVEPAGKGIEASRPLVEAVFDAATLMDGTTVELTLDGVALPAARIGYDRFVASPVLPLAGGKHTLRARGRAYGGNSSREAEAAFQVRTEPAVIALTTTPPVARAPYPQKVTAIVLDSSGNAVADSTPVDFHWRTGAATRVTSAGAAWILVGREVPFEATQITAQSGSAEATANLPGVPAAPASPGRAPRTPTPYVSGLVTDSKGLALAGAMLALAPASGASVSDRDGFFAIAWEGPPNGLEASKQGFKLARVDLDGEHFPEIRLERCYRSLPRGITVTIDPQGGGEATGWRGRAGISAAYLNLQVALRLKSLLASAGIETYLTRESDHNATRVERLTAAEAHTSALLVSIDHAAGKRAGAALGRFPGSSGGTRLARAIEAELKASFGYDSAISDDAEYVIQQTSCPAASVTFMAPRSPEQDALLADPCQVWARAYALLCGVLRSLGIGAEPGTVFAISGEVAGGSKPRLPALLVVDGTLEAPAPPNGKFSLRLLENGEHTLKVYGEAAGSRELQFDEKTGPLHIDLE